MHDPVDACMHDCIASQLQWAAAVSAIGKVKADLFAMEHLVIVPSCVSASMVQASQISRRWLCLIAHAHDRHRMSWSGVPSFAASHAGLTGAAGPLAHVRNGSLDHVRATGQGQPMAGCAAAPHLRRDSKRAATSRLAVLGSAALPCKSTGHGRRKSWHKPESGWARCEGWMRVRRRLHSAAVTACRHG